MTNPPTMTANELAAKQNWLCFYTGLKMEGSKVRGQVGATIEHLINRSVLERMPLNEWKSIEYMTTVASMAFANNLIGDAPLKVKYEIREECKNYYDRCMALPEEMHIEFMAAVIRMVLNRYRYRWGDGSTYVWRWRRENYKKHQEAMFPMWWELLTDEERNLHSKYEELPVAA